ncbi:PAS domain S-box protein [Halobacillus fulvus]|nr:PAS domain S-box protein [Halobacillus fulvus]
MEQLQKLLEKGGPGGSGRLPIDSLLHLLVEGISDYIFLMEVDGSRRFKYVLVNKAAQAHHPIEQESWEGYYIEDLLPPEKSAHLIEKYQRVFESREPFTYEDEMNVNGTSFCGHTSLTPIKDASGGVTHILAITRNITDIVNKERDLKKINAVYRSLMQNTADAIMIMDTESRVLEVNAAMEELYGFTKLELQTGSFPFVPEEKIEESGSLIANALRHNGVSNFQTVRKKKTGELIDVSMSLSPIENDFGETIGISAIIRDMTEIKNSERKLAASRSHYKSLFKHNPQPVFTLDLNGTITNANPASVQFLKKTKDELKEASFKDWLSEDHADWFNEQLNGALLEKDTWFQTKISVEDGEKVVFVYLVPIIRQNVHEGLYVMIDDITEKERAAEALRQSESKFRLIADHSNDMISVFSPYGDLLYASPSLQKFFGHNPMDLSKNNVTQLLLPKDLKKVAEAFEACQWHGDAFTVTLKLKGKTGRWVWFECRGTPVLNDDGRVNRIVVVARDISKQKQYEEQLKRIAFYDYLTGLPNRRLFEDRLEQAIEYAKRQKSSFALLYLDGDGFKKINDQYGHDMGDDFLRLVGDRMHSCIRKGDSIGRIGGDEFAIFLNDISSPKQAGVIASRILKELRQPYDLHGIQVASSFSIGVACYPEDGATLDDLFRSSDRALYYGKNKGKDQVCLFRDLT